MVGALVAYYAVFNKNPPYTQAEARHRAVQDVTAIEDQAVAAFVWERLEATPGFNEEMAQGLADVKAGRAHRWEDVKRRLDEEGASVLSEEHWHRGRSASCSICRFSGHPPPRGYIRIRTPDDPEDWTAEGDLPVGEPYIYSSGDVAVEVTWPDAHALSPSELGSNDG